jgi:hypothetical protein
MYSPFLTSSASGEPRPIYEGLYTIEGYMGGSIVYGLNPHPYLRRLMFHRFDMYFA